ncbi:MAG: OprD family outer membrane porin [Desulfuromonadaceae bacterium]
MTKADIFEKVQDRTGLTRKESAGMVEAVFVNMKRVAAILFICGLAVLLTESSSWADDFDEYDKIPTRVDDIRPTMEHREEAEEEEEEKKIKRKKEKGKKEEKEEEEEDDKASWLPNLPLMLKQHLKTSPPFLQDTTLNLRLRTIFSRRDNSDKSVAESLAISSALHYHSGWLYDRMYIGAVLYTLMPLYTYSDSKSQAPSQKAFTVLGQVYGRVKLMEGAMLNLYRYGEFNTPFVNRSDGKLIPYTFEGYTVTGRFGGKGGEPGLEFDGGYLLKIKDKNADNFIWMSEKAGATAQRGLAMLGMRYARDGFSMAAIDYYSDDIINIAYAETAYTTDITKDLGYRFAVQYTDQRSVGNNLLKGYDFTAYQVGIKNDISYRGALLTLAYTVNGRDANIINPWSGCPGHTSAIINDFNAAGENALYAKIAYDFSRIGLAGVTGSVAYAHGWGKISSKTKAAQPDADEYDADLLWQLKAPNLWLRMRFGVMHQYENPKQYTYDGRISLNYDFPLL